VNEIGMSLPADSLPSNRSNNNLLSVPDTPLRNSKLQGFGVTIQRDHSNSSMDTVVIKRPQPIDICFSPTPNIAPGPDPDNLNSLTEDGTKVRQPIDKGE
jgi:hypothetical protein